MIFAWIRHYFHVDPYALSAREIARLWREAQFLIEVTKPIQKE